MPTESQYESVLWAISVKANASQSQLQEAVGAHGALSTFSVPGVQLRVGTLDSLMSLSDDLVKMDALAEAAVAKMYKTVVDLAEGSLPDGPAVNGVPIVPYTLMRWEWEEAKFQLKQPVRELCETISSRIGALDEDLKLKMTEMNALKQTKQQSDRKTQGNLMVRGLADIVQERHVVDSEYICTVFPVVPKGSTKEFETAYERMAKYVVPRSAKLLKEDQEYALYAINIFRKSLDEFKTAAREKRVALREYTYVPGTLSAEETAARETEAQLADCKAKLSTWCTINFAEIYSMMIHLKAVRIFVESVLRYGLTETYSKGMVPNFKAFFIQVKKGRADLLRKALSAVYAVGASGKMMEGEDEAVVPGATGEFYPYVYTSIETAPLLQ